VQHDLDTGDLDNLVKGIFLSDIGHDNDVELLLVLVGIRLADLLRLLLGPHSGNYAVALGEELIQDVGRDEAGAASQENLGHFVLCW